MRWQAETPWVSRGRLLECNPCGGVFLVLFLILTACASAPSESPAVSRGESDRHEFTRVCMGVPTRIVVCSPDREAATEAAAAAYARISELDAIMSDYRRDSDLNHLCERAGGAGIQVQEALYDILAKAERVSRASGGVFDVTVGPAVALWRRARQQDALPTDAEVATARRLIGWEMVKLESGSRVRLVKPGMRLDLGGIAKGYAAQRAVEVLRDHGFSRVMVGLAGDIVVGDPPPGKEGWRIAVVGERVTDRVNVADRPVLVLRNAAVSTSGDAEQFVEVGGKRYSHIVDPATGMGMTALRSVTVVAATGEEADALSTAACLLGEARGRAMLEKWRDVGAVFEEGGEIRVMEAGRAMRVSEP